MKYHYTYRITNTIKKLHYYGARSSKFLPKNDLGKRYFSSSKDKDFIKDQKENPQNYKYKIIRVYETRKEAVNLEIKLHNKFNVGVNESFYNKSKQTSVGWDTTGIATVPLRGDLNGMYGKKHSDETKRLISEKRKGVPTTTGQLTVSLDGVNWFNIPKGEFDESIHTTLGHRKKSEETKQKIRERQLNAKIVTCPFCNKHGKPGMMKRWHFDYCNENPNQVYKDRTPHNKKK